MATSTNTLQATITATDAVGSTSINRGFGNPSLAGVVGDMVINQQLANGDNVMTLPAAVVFNVYVKNNAAAGSGQKIVIKVTPSGGVQAILAALEPGGVFCWWNVINTDNPGGYSAVTLNGSVASIPVEYFFGA